MNTEQASEWEWEGQDNMYAYKGNMAGYSEHYTEAP